MNEPNPDRTVQHLLDIEYRLAAAWTAGDCDAWSALLAPDWCVTHITGEVITREQALAMCRTPQGRAAELRHEDLDVRKFGDAAVVTGQTTATTASEPAETVVLRFTDVFIRRDGEWIVVASHATRIAAA